MSERDASPPDDVRPHIWISTGVGAAFPSGVFESKRQGVEWAAANRLTGTLSDYAVGVGTYDDAITNDRFRPAKPHHGTPEHIAGFSPQYDHVHGIDGATA